ncbi:MAG TPA: nucleoside-diphosphate kinase, partial [Candidatus Limnocylindrales bacterium]|nr:nucleoside-diphosphate kinase [Candidatus Limnocylindrales bacterium]
LVDRYERRGLRIAGLKLMWAERGIAEDHYSEHREKPFFGGLVEFITSGPLVAIAVEGPRAIETCRAINGATRPWDAAPGSIRGDFALEVGQNIVHASDGPEAAEREVTLWFNPDELLDYSRDVDRSILG